MESSVNVHKSGFICGLLKSSEEHLDGKLAGEIYVFAEC